LRLSPIFCFKKEKSLLLVRQQKIETMRGPMTGDSARAPQNLLTRTSREMLVAYRATGHWAETTIYDHVELHASSRPDAIAVEDSFSSLTYRQLMDLSEQIACRLAEAGLRPGDRVAAWMSNRCEMAPFLAACSRNGYVFCPSLHRNHTVEEIEILLRRMSASAVVAEQGFGADGSDRSIFEKISGMDHVLATFQLGVPVQRSASDIAKALEIGQPPFAPPSAHADDIVYLAFTSGTTGDPKGVMHSNNTLLANARALSSEWSFDTSTVNYTLSPLSHNLGFGALVLTLLVGGRIVLHDLPRGASLLDALRRTGATFVYGVPAHAIDLLAELRGSGLKEYGPLRGFRISGAAAASTLVQGLLEYGIKPQSGYGMTEAGSHHFTLPDDPAEKIITTSGRAAPGYEVRIFSVDDNNVEVPVGVVGQIGGRGASLMLGYYDNQSATENSFNDDGWFMTGDLGKLDDDGYLQITGRIKEIIIRGGHNIHPAKIELLAARHPDVERAAALPIKDERLGEKVCLIVMGRNDTTIGPEILLRHLEEHGLSKFDMPEYFAQVSEIPLSASGKMLKRALLPFLEDGTIKPEPVRRQAGTDWKGKIELMTGVRTEKALDGSD
jgi:acyl-CoA synthetase (AMP-forming)/AMP-acid ligase II